jgi:hypothetical protein
MQPNFSESATVVALPQHHLIAETLDGGVGRSVRQQAKGRAVLLTSVETGAFSKGLPVFRGAAAALFACVSIGFAGAAPAAADPGTAPAVNGPTDPVANAVVPPPPVDDGRVQSTPPVTTKSPDGWTLTVSAHDETELPVPSMMDEVATREYIVGGVFNGSVHAPAGAGTPRGTLEVGYQTACQVDTQLPAYLTFGSAPNTASDLSLFGPSIVTTVPVDTKEFSGGDPWVMISAFSITIDGGVSSHQDTGCIGQSFIRSYATLTAWTDTSNVTQSYYGTTKVI